MWLLVKRRAVCMHSMYVCVCLLVGVWVMCVWYSSAVKAGPASCHCGGVPESCGCCDCCCCRTHHPQASSAALKLGGWAVAAHNRQPLRAAARGLPGSSVARVSGGGRVRRHVPDLARPQDTFPDLVDNSEAPWSPAKFPHLAAQLAAAADSSAASSARAVGVHPYRAELGSLQYQPWQLQKQQQQADTAAAVDVMDLESVPVTLVDTTEGLAAMVSALEGVRQVALDLEHHAYR